MVFGEYENLREYGNVKNIVDWEYGNIREFIMVVGVLFFVCNIVGGCKIVFCLSYVVVVGFVIFCVDGFLVDW